MPRQVERDLAKRRATKSGSRYWEVDAARGVAILMMVVYHFTYDLYAFGGYDVDAVTGFWARFADATASLFLLLVGVSLAISAARGSVGFRPYLWRGLRILGYGILLTVVFLVFPGQKRGYSDGGGRFVSTRLATDVFFDHNQEGIWFLKATGQPRTYTASHPGRFRPTVFLTQVLQALGQL